MSRDTLNRQSDAYAREGIELDVSTLGDWVGASSATLAPLLGLICAHVLAGGRIHGDDTTVPVLAKGKTVTGRLWTYVRDDRPFGGSAAPAAMFAYSRDRTAEHPRRHLEGWQGILQADAYAGFNGLYDAVRQPGPIINAGCWAPARRNFSELAELAKAPLAVEAVRRIDAIFAAAIYSLIVTAKLNDVDPRAWLADALGRIADHPASRLHELLPWNWREKFHKPAVAA